VTGAGRSPEPGAGRWSLLLALAVAGLALLELCPGLRPAGEAQNPTPTTEQEVHAIAAQLRCVVCQNLSVADSPSEMAAQMRGIIRERLAAGERPAEVVQYFVDRYGEWVLLSPRRQGFNLLVWAAPGIALLAGLAVAALIVRRWRRRAAEVRRAPPPLDPGMTARIRREMESE
jgi:cytochrome c-type biogenesis protein CcmH